MRTIKNLINESKKVYIFLKDEETRKKFSLDCERENITFSDKVSVKERELRDVMALLPDSTICYLGTVSRICCKSGGDTAVMIDYKKYIEKSEDYIIDPKEI